MWRYKRDNVLSPFDQIVAWYEELGIFVQDYPKTKDRGVLNRCWSSNVRVSGYGKLSCRYRP